MPPTNEVELTDAQVNQQDLIDDLITQMILSVKPEFVHDIEYIGSIRDALVSKMSEILGIEESVIYP
jgi:hypothetical protein